MAEQNGTPQSPDSVITTQRDGQTIVAELFFNHSGTETFRDKLLKVILSRLVDTFISRISLTMLPVPNPHNTVCVLSWEEARHWQSRSSGYSSS